MIIRDIKIEMDKTLRNSAFPADDAAQLAVTYALQQQYKILSEVRDLFPAKSTHKGCKRIDERMDELIKQLDV